MDFPNGIDAETGRDLGSPFADPAHPPRLYDVTLDAQALRERRWLVEQWQRPAPRLFVRDVDPRSLAEVGWGVIFAPDVDTEVEKQLQPLLERRRRQAGELFQRFTCGEKPSKDAFLADSGALLGPVDPRKVPYYLLIVGDPRSIPFRFQYELDFQYAVGRVHFEDPADYGRYAESVVAVETGKTRRPRRQLTLFAVDREGDRSTERMSRELIKPLAAKLATWDQRGVPRPWSQRLLLGEHATKAQLRRVLGGEDSSALLLSACHGMKFKSGSASQESRQGALLCQDWPGSDAGKPDEEQYLAAYDLKEGAQLGGMIVLSVACYSAGTPELSDFDRPDLGRPERIAPHPFVAGLPQRLLGGGALAVVGHVDRSWSSFFSWHEDGDQTQVMESVLRRLMEGHSVGHAMEYVNYQYAALSVELSNMFADQATLGDYSQGKLDRLWQATNDARNFVVLGDPAVRVDPIV